MKEDANTDCKLGSREVASILRTVADVIEKELDDWFNGE